MNEETYENLFEDGYLAEWVGTTCPHDVGTEEHIAWTDGFEASKFDKRAGKIHVDVGQFK